MGRTYVAQLRLRRTYSKRIRERTYCKKLNIESAPHLLHTSEQGGLDLPRRRRFLISDNNPQHPIVRLVGISTAAPRWS